MINPVSNSNRKNRDNTITTAIVYPFFAHYRAAIIKRLLTINNYNFQFFGDKSDPDGSIKSCQIPQPYFTKTKCHLLPKGILWQEGIIHLALSRNVDCIIYLGNAKFASTWISASLARLTGKRVLFWTHGWLKHEKGIIRKLRNTFYRLAHGLLLYGTHAREIGASEGYPASRLHVVYNSLDYSRQKKIRELVTQEELHAIKKKYSHDANFGYIIYTGRLTKECRLNEAIMALSYLKKNKNINISLLLVGTGTEEKPLRNLANSLSVPITFYGPCYDENTLAVLIMGAHATVSPGKIGLTAMHSLAYGTPVITHSDINTQMPEVEAISPGINGELFQKGNITALANAIFRCTTRHNRDPAKCYDIIETRYNPDFQAKEIVKAISARD